MDNIIGGFGCDNGRTPPNRSDPLSGCPSLLSLDIPFFLLPIFFGLTARELFRASKLVSAPTGVTRRVAGSKAWVCTHAF
jgi:hypothetical protein